MSPLLSGVEWDVRVVEHLAAYVESHFPKQQLDILRCRPSGRIFENTLSHSKTNPSHAHMYENVVK
jgi:hypothetical protein